MITTIKVLINLMEALHYTLHPFFGSENLSKLKSQLENTVLDFTETTNVRLYYSISEEEADALKEKAKATKYIKKIYYHNLKEPFNKDKWFIEKSEYPNTETVRKIKTLHSAEQSLPLGEETDDSVLHWKPFIKIDFIKHEVDPQIDSIDKHRINYSIFPDADVFLYGSITFDYFHYKEVLQWLEIKNAEVICNPVIKALETYDIHIKPANMKNVVIKPRGTVFTAKDFKAFPKGFDHFEFFPETFVTKNNQE